MILTIFALHNTEITKQLTATFLLSLATVRQKKSAAPNRGNPKNESRGGSTKSGPR